MNGYKAENPYFQSAEYSDLSNNCVEDWGDVFLGYNLADGTNDSSSNIASQVNGSSSDQNLQLINSASTTSVSIPGL